MKNPLLLLKKPGKDLKKKITVIVCIVLAIAVAAGGTWYVMGNMNKAADTTITPYTVERGDISVVVSGSGTVEPIEQYNIVSLVSGEILSDNVTVGQTVKADDVLYTIDTSDAENNIKQSEIALQKQQLSYNQEVESYQNLTVTVPASGVVTALYVENGDNVSSGTKIADVVDSQTLKLKVPFNASDAAHLSLSQKAQVCLDSNGETLYGKITQLYTGTYVTGTGAIVSDVEITFTNPGAVTDSETATAMIGGYACNSSGTISYGSAYTISAKTSGEVTGLKTAQGDKVTAGSTLLSLSSPSSSVNLQSGKLSIEDAQLNLENMKNKLNEYIITSPISGTIIEKDYKGGDSLDDNKTTLAVVADMSKLTFTMSIDELDISQISVNQEVVITADALPDAEFSGYISNIGIIGTSSNGVTTYPVEVVIEAYEGLLPGMNVNADIVASEVTDVLKVPVDAVTRGNAVLVTEEYTNSLQTQDASDDQSKLSSASPAADTAQDGSAPAMGGNGQKGGKKLSDGDIIEMPDTPSGYKYIKVTTGLNDEDYIEITGGLTEGAQVFIVTTAKDETAAETETSSNAGMMGGGMGGGDMGGPPAGGGGPMG